MTYADLIKLLEPYADKKVFIDCYENRTNTEVHFYAGSFEFLELSRRYGKDEVTVKRYDQD